jgi:RNase P subunit RPR2
MFKIKSKYAYSLSFYLRKPQLKNGMLQKPKTTSLIKYNLNIPFMAVIYCKKCGEYRYLTPHAFWNVNDLNVKCKDCGTINIITIENGEIRKQV